MDESRLDLDRVRRIAAVRRAELRSRQWRLVLRLLVLAGVAGLIGSAGAPIWLAGLVCLPIAFVLIRRYAAKPPAAGRDEPTTTPDFSTLDNGSHQVRDLENIRDE